MEENLKLLLEERKRLELRLERIEDRLKDNLEKAREEYNLNLSSDYPTAIRQQSAIKEVEEEYRKRAADETKEVEALIESQNTKIGAELREIRDGLLRDTAPVEKELKELKPQLEEAEQAFKEEEAKFEAERMKLYRQGIFANPDSSKMDSARAKMEELKQKALSLENSISEKQARIDSINQFFGTIRIKDTKVEDIEKIVLGGQVQEEKQAKTETPETSETKTTPVEEVRAKVETSETKTTQRTNAKASAETIYIEAKPVDIIISGKGIQIGDSKISYEEYRDIDVKSNLKVFKEDIKGIVDDKKLEIFSLGDEMVIMSLYEAASANEEISDMKGIEKIKVRREAVKKLFASYINDYYELIMNPSQKDKSSISITYDLRSKSMPSKLMTWIKGDVTTSQFVANIKEEARFAREFATVKTGPITKLEFMIKDRIERAKQKKLEKASNESTKQQGKGVNENKEIISPENESVKKEKKSWDLSKEERDAVTKGEKRRAEKAEAEGENKVNFTIKAPETGEKEKE